VVFKKIVIGNDITKTSQYTSSEQQVNTKYEINLHEGTTDTSFKKLQ